MSVWESKVARQPNVWVAVVVIMALVLGFAVYKFAPSTIVASSATLSMVDRIPVIRDSDHDGVPDQAEVAGWRTGAGAEHRTDPRARDSDGDGLSDGEEAGLLSWVEDGTTIYVGRSDPNNVDSDGDGLSDAVETGTISDRDSDQPMGHAVSDPLVADSDADGIGDGGEYFLDMDPLAADTDGDGLDDHQELEFGSDPTLVNSDKDSYSDKEEYAAGSRPWAYDLTDGEQVAAARGGLLYGDCYECAHDAGLRIEQVESAEYLAGHYVSGIVMFGDFRDIGINIWKQNFVLAGLAALALLPIVGDGSKVVALFTKFAKRGDRAEQAVREATAIMPMSTSVKSRIIASLPSRVGRLPRELGSGPRNYMVYKASTYIGITNNFALRKSQHASAGRSFQPEPMEGADRLTWGEAHAIEQACIELGGLATKGGRLENRINSIDPKHDYYDAAVAWAHRKLKKIGGSCPVPATR